MSKIINVLIVEDHPTMIEGYKGIIRPYYSDAELRIISVHNCEEASKAITSPQFFDVILLDVILPPDEKNKIFTGEDLALLIQKTSPNTKIMILTSHTETFLLFNIIKKINPEGLLIKSDFGPTEFLLAFKSVLQGKTFYSPMARQSLKDVCVENNYLDAYNRKIITLIAKGIATKNLPDHLNITISAIDKRKAQIKDFFNIQKGNDEDIIREAKKRGFI